MTVTGASIVKHTTASSPRPHILYVVKVLHSDGSKTEVPRRYSEFVQLHTSLGDPEALPPKRILVTSFVPSAWADDKLIAERKEGLSAYLSKLLQSPVFASSPALLTFLGSATSSATTSDFSLEDALPSTLSRKTALQTMEGLVKAESTTPIAAAYYPDWATGTIAPQNIDFSKFDILLFAFATPNSSNGLNWDSGATSTLQTLVSSAHNSGYDTKVVLSIGGWSGSYWFSQVMNSSNNSAFVQTCVDAVNTYDLDGIDIDWEYPNESGAGNLYSSDDAANLLTFFTSLRSALGSGKIISAAVADLPWVGSNGKSLTDVSAYAQQMTYANIMNYDVNGASTTAPGPNAPLGNLCGNSSQPHYSAEAAVSQWTAANFPAGQLVLGLPLYGYVSESSATALTDFVEPGEHGSAAASASADTGPALDAYRQRVLGMAGKRVDACPLPAKGDSKRAKPNFLKGAHPHARPKGTADVVRAQDAGDLSSYWGQEIAFNQIVALGALQETSDGTFVQANGYTEGWDNCSDTPFLYDTARTTVVTYDDTYSLGDKASYAKSAGIAGCFTWSLDQDYNYVLQDAIRSNLGLS
ncbi:glycoside hydrolase family 18 protein [Daedalea quercina L-15889]|uniref:Glycoside hydrolase family 18 protein n=1 Tax=Daedalea quercina L-15889 TaxID=1314783 RepID=A0A165R457_9APHY|nr:glycoside hydrolase family 18 protein [Daedalea quercina L-15889]